METGMLNSLHNEEEQFAIGGRSASHDSESPQWSGDTVGNGSQLSPESEEGTGEDFDRTLSDWRRHVASLPMSDSEDYIVDEVNEGLNDTPSPCKAEKFSFSPDTLSPQTKVDNLSIKPENIVRSKNSIHMGKVRGDNRMMDNDNTSTNGNFYATINSVVYELDSDPNEKYIAYHGNSELDHDFISSTIQVISVDPDTLDISDTSSEGSVESSRCSSPYNNSSENEKSDCEDDANDLVCERDEEQDIVCVEDDDDEDDEIQYTEEDVICVNSVVPQTPPREISSRSSMLKDKCSPSSESSVDSFTAHVETPIERRTESSNSCHITPLPVLMNCNITPETTFSRRQKLKSISLPQSPSHCVDTPGQDFQPCMTFEDLKLIDFDRMFNISPSKVFNKHFDLPEVFDEHVPHFPETVSFDPIVDIKTKRDPECTLKSINNSQLNESKTTTDIIGIIDKNGMLDKNMDSSDLLFNPKNFKDDLHEDFDLTSFITGEGDGDSSHLLKENFISSPLMMKSKLKEEGRRHYGQNIDKFEIDMSNVIMSTPKRNMNGPTEIISVMTLIDKDVNWPPDPKKAIENNTPVKTPMKLKSNFSNYPREPLVMRITKSEGNLTPKEDSEDYIDVETVSDSESFPVLAANNLDSLLEQFEATEKISKRVNSLNGSEGVVEIEPASKYYSADDWEAKTEQFSTAWSQPLKPPQQKKLNSSRSPERKHYGSLTEMANIVSPCLSKSTHSTSTESVQLDHDYCSPIRRASNHLRTISSSTDGDSESLRSFTEDSFISPKPSSITAFYKQINISSNRMLGLGKGKNIAMCMEHRTDEFKTVDSPDSVHSLLIKTPKKTMSTESLLKVIDASPSIARSDLSDSDCSMSDHSYSKVDTVKMPDTHTFITPIKNNKSTCVIKSKSAVKPVISGGKVANKKMEVMEAVVDVTCDKNVKKNVVVTLKSDIERLSEFNKNPPPPKTLSKNTKVNRNSLLISNFNNNSDMVFVKQNKGFLQNNQEKSLLRQKQSLLKPIVKEEIKKVSLLKNNYVEKEVVKEVVKEVEAKVEVKVKSVVEVVNEVVLKSSENVPVKKMTSQKAVEIFPIEVIMPDEPKENTIEIIKPAEKKQPLKRKLNLEEYKKRREGSTRSCETSRTSSPVTALSDNWASSSPNSPVPVTNDLPPPKAETTNTPSLTEMLQNVLSNSKHPIAPEIVPEKIQEAPPVQAKKEVEKVVETETKLYDPIAEASKKAIQLKKLAAQRCNEDKIVQSKIPKLENVVILPMVTENGKVLPMTKSIEEIIVESPKLAPARRKNSEYEEIVMVSVGVNTNPVIFLEPELETVSEVAVPDDAVTCDDGAKNGIQFTIKKKSNIAQKNVFDSVLVVPELPIAPIVEDVCSDEVIIVNPKTFHSSSKSSCNGRSKPRREPKSDVKEKEEINEQNSKAMTVTLNNLNATLQKVEMRKDLKISRNSLLASIQKVVRKKNYANKSPDISKDSSKHNGHSSSSKHHGDKTSHSSEHHRAEKTKYSEHVERTKQSDVDKSKQSEHNDKSSHLDNVDKSKLSPKHSEQGEIANHVAKTKENTKLVEKIKHSEVIEKTNDTLKLLEKNRVSEPVEKIKTSDAKQKKKNSDQRNAAFKLIVCDIPKTSPKISKSPLPDCGKSSPHQIPLPEETVKEEPPALDHGEDKVIMHLKKDRPRPEMCSLSVQTDSIIIQDIVDEVAIVPVVPEVETVPVEETTVQPEFIPTDDVLELTCKHNIIMEETLEVPEAIEDSKHDEVNRINNDKKERSYRKRRDSSTSEGSIDSHSQRRRNSNNYGYGRGYSASSRRTNSIERHRKSYSPPRGRYRSRSPNRYNNKRNRNFKTSYRNSRNHETRYSRRSRSISRDRRRRFDSRERSDRALSFNRKDRTLSRSSAGYRRSDNRSVRSVPSSSKRRRVLSQSPNCKRKQSTGGSTDRHPSNHRSISRAKEDNVSGIQREESKKMETPTPSVADSCEMNNGYRSKGTRRRTSTDRSRRSHRSHSQSSTSSDSSCSSSSSSSSSSSGSSYDSEASSVFNSGQETMSQKGNRFANCVESGLAARQHPQRKAEPIEERRVVFIGRLEPELTKEDLRRKFVKYGQVVEVTLHRKDDGTRYGFVTFSKAEQSYRVVERANLDPELGRYDVSFGGRRAFCRHLYADLDDLETLEDIDYYGVPVRRPPPAPRAESSFDSLLEQMRMAVEAKRARSQRGSPRI